MIKTKVTFLEGRLYSSKSELFEYFLIALIGWIKSALQKSHFCFCLCKQAIYPLTKN